MHEGDFYAHSVKYLLTKANYDLDSTKFKAKGEPFHSTVLLVFSLQWLLNPGSIVWYQNKGSR